MAYLNSANKIWHYVISPSNVASLSWIVECISAQGMENLQDTALQTNQAYEPSKCVVSHALTDDIEVARDDDGQTSIYSFVGKEHTQAKNIDGLPGKDACAQVGVGYKTLQLGVSAGYPKTLKVVGVTDEDSFTPQATEGHIDTQSTADTLHPETVELSGVPLEDACYLKAGDGTEVDMGANVGQLQKAKIQTEQNSASIIQPQVRTLFPDSQSLSFLDRRIFSL